MGVYDTALENLNQRQRQAVETIDGPVLVVAGPGTGKTQLLSMRVAYILRTTDTAPQQILCLTFTNAAAANMRERLRQLAGHETQKVMVKTFHGFAAEIMQRYPDYFWSGARLTTVPDAVQIDIIETILSELPLDNPLAAKFAGSFTMLGDILGGLQLAKEAGLTPEKLKAILEVNLAYLDIVEPELVDILTPTLSVKRITNIVERINQLPEQPIGEYIAPLLPLHTVLQESLYAAVIADDGTGKTAAVGAWKKRFMQTERGQKGMFAERKRNQWWLYLAEVYQRYRDALHAKGYYDYSDMILEVITQLEKHDDLRATVQEQFSYVLIDEFQDTNAAQVRLAHLVADHYSSNGRPNFMVVGDDDQSIFKFNGAELNTMLQFRHAYRDVTTIVLTDNYRSTQAVLNTAQQTIEHASYRLSRLEPDIVKTLTAKATIRDGTIEHVLFPTAEHQRYGVAEMIADAYASGTHDIAVLARSHDSLRRIAASLHSKQIPVRYEQQQNILDVPVVTACLELAAAAVSIADGDISRVNLLVSTIVRQPYWNIQPSSLWEIALQARQSKDWLATITKADDHHAQQVGHLLLGLALLVDSEPISVSIEYVLGLRALDAYQSQLMPHLMNQQTSSELIASLSAVRLLLQLCQDFAQTTGQASLRDLVRYAELMRQNEKIISDQTPFVSGTFAVQLLTAHKSKGLEFEHVYIIDAMEQFWQPRTARRLPPANLPLQRYGDDEDDYARLMYVALTRAKRSITVSSFAFNDANEPVLPTPLVAHIQSHSRTADMTPMETTVQVLSTAMSWPRLNLTDEKQLLAPLLENYRLSATGLLQYLDVTGGGPQTFLKRSILRVPEPTTNSMSFGTAVHAALEVGQRAKDAGNYDIGAVLTAYEQALGRAGLPTNDFEKYTQYGQQLLSAVLADPDTFFGNQSLAELPLEAKIGDAHIVGKLDRIDTTADTVTIIDYKTGKPLNSFDTRDKTKQIKAWRHRMQLVFYSLLAQQDARFAQKKCIGTMVYLETPQKSPLWLSHTATSEELTTLRNLIQIVWRHILNGEFPNTDHYSQDMEGIQSFMLDLLDNK